MGRFIIRKDEKYLINLGDVPALLAPVSGRTLKVNNDINNYCAWDTPVSAYLLFRYACELDFDISTTLIRRLVHKWPPG